MNDVSEIRLRFYPMLLGLWLILIIFLLNFIGTANIFINLLLVVCTSILSVTKAFRYSAGISGVISALIFGYVEFQTQGWTGKAAAEIGFFTALILITAYLGSLTGQIINQSINQLSQYRSLIGVTGLYDQAIKPLKLTYAKQRLNNEILRGQRYHRDLCVMMIQLGNLIDSETTMYQMDRDAIVEKLLAVLKPTLRAVDVVFDGDAIGIILPETNLQGSRTVAERIRKVANDNGFSLFMGISHFPSDAVTAEDMLKAAETAVQIAQNNHQPFAFFSEVRVAVEESNVTNNSLQ